MEILKELIQFVLRASLFLVVLAIVPVSVAILSAVFATMHPSLPVWGGPGPQFRASFACRRHGHWPNPALAC
jgi:hypothetical protein